MSCLHPIIVRGPEVGSFGLLGVCVVLMWLPVVFFGSPSVWKGLTCSILMLFSFEGNSALVLLFFDVGVLVGVLLWLQFCMGFLHPFDRLVFFGRSVARS